MSTTAVINIVVIMIIVWFFYSRFKPVKGVRTLKASDFQSEMKGKSRPVVVDVREREPGEYKSGYINGAVNIPLSQLKQRLGEIPKDKAVLLYCQSGMRSKSAANLLSKNGFSEIAHLQGGITAWKGKLSSR